MNAGDFTDLLALFGAALCVGLGSVGAALGEGCTARGAQAGMARQPGAREELLRTLLVGQAVAESAGIFALVVAVLLLFPPRAGGDVVQAVRWLSAGVCMGLGALGSGYGAGRVGEAGCLALARNPRARQPVQTTMLVGQAVTQTPAVFALLVALLLLFLPPVPGAPSLPRLVAPLAAALCGGLGGIGPGVGAGRAAVAACHGVAAHPRKAQVVLRTLLVGQAVTQSTAVYALLVALILIGVS